MDLNSVITDLENMGYQYLETVYYDKQRSDQYTLFLERDLIVLILDVNICKKYSDPFSYADYTQKQNEYMFRYQQCYRFYIDNQSELEEALLSFNLLTDQSTFSETSTYKLNNRDQSYVDNSPLESFFEDCFTEVYGNDSHRYLTKEYALTDIQGNNIFVDYVVETNQKKIAIEENGIRYHHPQLIGKEKYICQLVKQNSLVHYNFTIFRWSTEHLKFKEKVCESIQTYFGSKHQFIDKADLTVSRHFKLYEHQQVTLDEIVQARQNGDLAFLVVLPTATGKSKIIEEDLKRLLMENNQLKVLIMVPTIRIKLDWLSRIKVLADQSNLNITYGDTLNHQIVVTTYISIYKQLNQINKDHFDYIAVDEAHHAVAPTARKVIQYLNPQFLIGITATPERLDKKRLEDIFGNYQTKISLEEAIKQNIIAPIRAFRIESNLNLSSIRFNGKDYINTDLERGIRVTSRNDLIAKVLKQYFIDSGMPFKQGLIFCVNIKHAVEMAKILNTYGISAQAVSGSDKNSQSYIEDYNNQKIQFLCACNLISEGWDSPQTSILVMARPTLSKVLYLQQLGRGLRKYHNKECLYVIDVIDQYGAMNAPWSCHSIFGNNLYLPFGDILNRTLMGNEMQIISGLFEEIQAIKEIDIFTFEQKYGDYLSLEQLARELFVSTGTVRHWLNKQEITPDIEIPFGNKKLPMFNPVNIGEIRKLKNLKEHTEETIKEDFFDFINEKSYTFSFKMVFILALLKCIDDKGNANIDKISILYKQFYQERIDNNIKVDRDHCIYTKEYLADTTQLKQNMLSNPFEKFERKRFIYYCKDLAEIGFNTYLWNQLTKHDITTIKNLLYEHLKEYYQDLDGLLNIEYLL